MSNTSRLAIVLAINVVLVLIQTAAGIISHSTGLLSDAGHNLADVGSIIVSIAATRWSLKPRSHSRSFGNYRSTILAALLNSAILATATVLIVVESIHRLIHPVLINASVVIPVATVALIANGCSGLILRTKSNDLNMRSNVIHMMADSLSSFVVLLAGVIILVAGGGNWNRADSIASLLVAALIVIEIVRLSKASIAILLESTPGDINIDQLRELMLATRGVDDVHDLHVWSLSSDIRALSAHLVLSGHPSLEEAQTVAGSVRERIEGPFDIAHTTLELECERCIDESDVADPCAVDDRGNRGKLS